MFEAQKVIIPFNKNPLFWLLEHPMMGTAASLAFKIKEALIIITSDIAYAY